jgi:hypothetical protein
VFIESLIGLRKGLTGEDEKESSHKNKGQADRQPWRGELTRRLDTTGRGGRHRRRGEKESKRENKKRGKRKKDGKIDKGRTDDGKDDRGRRVLGKGEKGRDIEAHFFSFLLLFPSLCPAMPCLGRKKQNERNVTGSLRFVRFVPFHSQFCCIRCI